ncbi:hypothetical protein [Mucilaginibacter flavidus]|uniref:hypothetical protein n=1 Tax=Mucilaginibacter flavidus TaxID=2949309 RepID=UPI0020920F2E|nr:hypothetical protein [Mucilaginibacter flavidus]MCO5947776.1 hypothetical protein [Mucilaginibacter flavidus]
MFGSNILEVAIGIIFVYILVSTICTAVREGIESRFKTRAAYLEQGIRQLLHDLDGNGLAASLYQHPLINGLFNGSYVAGKQTTDPDLLSKGGDLPSYIPAKNFAMALMDIAANGAPTNANNSSAGAAVINLETMRNNVAAMDNLPVQRILLNAIDNAQGDLNKAQKNIEDWFNSGMDRVSGWYKRSTQWIIFWIALAVTVLLNVNTISIVKYLSQNDTARKIVVERASVISKDSTFKNKDYNSAKTELNDLKLPIGWDGSLAAAELNSKAPFGFWNGLLGPLLGWLLTAFAATLGAPFWFDMLNKVMIIRSTVKPHEKSGEEASRDPQKPQPQVVYINPAPQPTTGVIPAETNTTEPDGCEADPIQLTNDEDLPASKGGM